MPSASKPDPPKFRKVAMRTRPHCQTSHSGLRYEPVPDPQEVAFENRLRDISKGGEDETGTRNEDRLSIINLELEIAKMQSKNLSIEFGLNEAGDALRSTDMNIREVTYSNNYRDEERTELVELLEGLGRDMNELKVRVREANAKILTVCSRVRVLGAVQTTEEPPRRPHGASQGESLVEAAAAAMHQLNMSQLHRMQDEMAREEEEKKNERESEEDSETESDQ